MTAVLPRTADVRKALPADAPAVASALAVAFTDDPVFCWMLPDDDVRPVATRTFFDIVVDILAPHDEAWTTAAGVSGAALWVPAGQAPMSDQRAEQFADELADLWAPHADRVLELIGLMDSHHPHQPHEYLWFLGVVPAAQGRGLGSALMTPMLERADAAGHPAYLEATSPAQQGAVRAARVSRRRPIRRRRRPPALADVARPGLTLHRLRGGRAGRRPDA